MSIHPTALVDPRAELGADVEIGPYAIVGSGVTVGDRCRIGPHSCLQGPLELGADCVVAYNVALGHDPQVKGKPGPWGRTRIGARCELREFSQVHRSMFPDGETVLGDDLYMMATAHVAHDCQVGDEVTICNGALLSGHVEVGRRAFLSGVAVIHQFVRIGEFAMVAGQSGINRDVPPYCTAVGDRPKRLAGLNLVGLRRAGVSAETRRALKEAFRVLFRTTLPVAERLQTVDSSVPEVAHLVDFVRASRRGVTGIGDWSGAD